MSEIRQNRLTGEWVIIAPERAKRGGNLGQPVGTAAPVVVPEFAVDCPFCPGNELLSGADCFRIDDEKGRWAVRSVANKFSALSPTGEVPMMDGCGEQGCAVNGVGLHEVVVESPRHDLTLAQFSPAQVERVLKAWEHRFRAFYADSRVRHVILFKNHGAEAGASQQHPHSQIVGIPIMPGQVVDRIERGQRFFAESGQCLTCTIIAQEKQQGARLIAENEDFIAFIPYAALSPYHVWILPKVHAASFPPPVEALRPLAEILRMVLAKIHGLLGNPPFNLVIRSLSPNEKDGFHFHWYISIIARVNRTAGFELGTGMYINPSLPEGQAQKLSEYRAS
jgi:UDPglucose--hexose-1-phosphate uridylyltransferase